MRRLRGRLVPAYLLVLLLGAGALFQPTGALAVQFDVNIDIPVVLSGTLAQLAFDFIDGDFVANNTATISGFATNGLLGGSSTSGDVSGTPPNVTLTDTTSFLNELLQAITLGTSVSFSLEMTTDFAGGVPDSFSFFILDDAGTSSLVTTDLPGDALFQVDIDGSPAGSLLVSGATAPNDPNVTATVTAVPGPSALLLSVLGLAAILLRGIRRRPRQPTLS